MLKQLVIVTLVTLGMVATIASVDTVNCPSYAGLDLSQLYRSEKIHEYRNANITVTFTLCNNTQKPSPCGDPVCLTERGVKSSIGRTISSLNASSLGHQLMTLEGTKAGCADGSHVYVYFSCNKNSLGAPELLAEVDCNYYFEWRSTIACPTIKATQPIPCYVYDSDNKLYDLSPLTKATGFRVEGAEGMLINVCQNLTVPGCSGGACLGNKTLGVVNPASYLQFDANGKDLFLKYDVPAVDCASSISSVMIQFVCGQPGTRHEPQKLDHLSSSDCNTVVMWETSYACPVETISSDGINCRLHADLHGVDVDLRNLTGVVSVPGDKYVYTIAMCGSNVTGCVQDQRPTAVCQRPITAPFNNFSLGRTDASRLLYSDNELRLEYRSGIPCSGSSFNRETVISFICNASVDYSAPTFVKEDNCTYLFDWQTKFACVKSFSCEVIGNADIDLHDLQPPDKDSWSVDRAGVLQSGAIYLKVCGAVDPDKDPTSNCDGRAGVCLVDGTTARNLGVPSGKPELKGGSVVLTYDKGDPCGSGTYETHVSLICDHSGVGRVPVLTKIENSCVYNIEWRTSSACPKEATIGSDCKVIDEAGSTLDLSGLEVYNITDSHYVYTVALCKPACEDAGACQRSLGSVVKLGKPSSSLRYQDGLISVAYEGGDPYNDANHTPRRSVHEIICDRSMTDVPSITVDEQPSNHTYLFRWRTAFACRQQPCMGQDDRGVFYDFSSLRSSRGWSTSTSSGVMASLNVCGAVPNTVGCGKDVGACITETGKEPKNIGFASSAIFSYTAGYVTLTYTGPECIADISIPFKTVIRFACSAGDFSSGPQFEGESSTRCIYTFVWRTALACRPDSPLPSLACAVKQPGSDYVYNLTLAGMTQAVVGGTNYTINLCGPLDPSFCGLNASVCKGNVRLASAYPSLSMRSNTELEASTDLLSVYYTCDHMAELPNITSVEQAGTRTIISVNTTLACGPKPLSCDVWDEFGNRYDLRSLTGRNWIAQGLTDQMTYFFSVCGPLDKNGSSGDVMNCPDGAIGACQKTNSQPPEYINLGYPVHNPTASNNDTVRLHYVNGKPCGHGNLSGRQTLIEMHCSDIEKDPIMKEENGDCDYTIWWETPSACPVKNAPGNNCAVDGFNLTALALNGTRQVEDMASGHVYYVSVCLAVSGFGIEGCSGAGVCQKTSDGFINAGNASSVMQANNGLIQLTYENGAPCRSGPIRKTVITFVCPSADQSEGPYFIKEDNCYYTFEWRTVLVCPTVESVQCTLTSITAGGTFDLSSLTLHDSNYETHSSSSNETYFLNVCHQLKQQGSASHCPRGSAACMYDSHTQQYLSLGHLTPAERVVSVFGDIVFIKYSGGSVCPSDSSRTMSSAIAIYCDPQATVPPALVSTGTPNHDPCRRDFTWQAAAACKQQRVPSTTSGCAAIGGLDPKALSRQFKVDGGDHYYYVNFCSPSDVSQLPKCGDKTDFGVCQVSKVNPIQQVMAGNTNITAVKQGDLVTFIFNSGDICMHDPGKSPRKTVLTLFCDPSARVDSQPQFTYEMRTDCTYKLSWPRPELCSHTDVCHVLSGGNMFDLAELSKSQGYYIADPPVGQESSNDMYYINICQPLPPITGAPCPPGSAICKIPAGDREKAVSLGHVSGSPIFDSGKVSLRFVTDTKCPSSDAFVSTIIQFQCRRTLEKGKPRLTDTDGCTYNFIWETYVACPKEVVPSDTSLQECKVRDTRRDYDINFGSLKDHQYEAGGYNLSVCSALTSSRCGIGATVCKGDLTFGTTTGAQFNMRGTDVVLQYTGISCRTSDDPGRVSFTTITFVCDWTADSGSPVLDSQDACQLSFTWKTKLACVPTTEDCTLQYKGNYYDFRLLMNYKNHFELLDGMDRYYVNICSDIIVSSSGCPSGTNVCLRRADGVSHSLGISATHSISVLEGDQFVLTYSSSDTSACSNSLKPTVNFVLSCANRVGAPVFQGYNAQNCTYTFSWQTVAACKQTGAQAVSVTQNGELTDPETKDIFSLADLMQGSYNVTVYPHEYMISLAQPLGNLPVLSPNCSDGQTLACQYSTLNSFRRSIGRANSKQFYFDDGFLQLVMQSESRCGRTNATAGTVIDFTCNINGTKHGSISFLYESQNCQYIFQWDTLSMCEPIAHAAAMDSPAPKSLSAGVTAAIVIIALAAIITVSAFVIYKLRKHRRWPGNYEYSELQADDDSTLLIAPGTSGQRYSPADDDDDDHLINI